MKTTKHFITLASQWATPSNLLLPAALAAVFSLSGCAKPPPPRPRVAVVKTLPPGYAGDAYFYGGNYYVGGVLEPGPFLYGGVTYENRYVHDGRYLYGGRHFRR